MEFILVRPHSAVAVAVLPGLAGDDRAGQPLEKACCYRSHLGSSIASAVTLAKISVIATAWSAGA